MFLLQQLKAKKTSLISPYINYLLQPSNLGRLNICCWLLDAHILRIKGSEIQKSLLKDTTENSALLSL